MTHTKKWQEVTRKMEYKKYSHTIERRDYRMPDGEIRDYYVHIESPAVCVLALTPDNYVITVPQYRPGPNAILREIPGGNIDEGEGPIEAGHRELLEETGYAGTLLADWVGTWEADAYTELNRNVIIVTNCKKVAEQQLEQTEFIEVELVTLPDFIAQVRTGKLTDTAGALLALDHLGLLR